MWQERVYAPVRQSRQQSKILDILFTKVIFLYNFANLSLFSQQTSPSADTDSKKSDTDSVQGEKEEKSDKDCALSTDGSYRVEDREVEEILQGVNRALGPSSCEETAFSSEDASDFDTIPLTNRLIR
jgi:hypothetical protein